MKREATYIRKRLADIKSTIKDDVGLSQIEEEKLFKKFELMRALNKLEHYLETEPKTFTKKELKTIFNKIEIVMNNFHKQEEKEARFAMGYAIADVL